MSDTIWPVNQMPTPCDFGPFAGGYCGKLIVIETKQNASNIATTDMVIELFETATATIDLNDLVTSAINLDWSKTTFSTITGNLTYDAATGILIYKPDETPSVNRIVILTYNVFDTFGATASGKITINVIDKTPTLTAGPINLSGTEGQTYTIDTRTYITASNTTVNFSSVNGVIISVAPTEGTATIINGIITYTPSQAPSTNRTITFKYKVTDLTGLQSEGNISIALTDTTPALTTNNFTKTVLDTANLSGSILSNITIKNDTFKTLTFGAISEGTIVASGSNYTFTPNSTISSNRTLTVSYTVTTNSGLTSTSTMTITINDDNIWAGTFWYGNSTKDIIDQAEIETLSSVRKTAYAGTYALTAGTQVYKWFIYPKAWGINPTILDAATLFELATDEYKYITINGVELICIRTYYKVNGAINVRFS